MAENNTVRSETQSQPTPPPSVPPYVPPSPPPVNPVPSGPRGPSSETRERIRWKDDAKDGKDANEEVCRLFTLYDNWAGREKDKEEVNISLYNRVDSLSQEGPTCGFVAFAMALKLLEVDNRFAQVTVRSLIEDAQQLGFTKQGEMFSVTHLQKIAQSFGLEAEIKTNLKGKVVELMKHLSEGWPVLVPYDADGNHEPSLKKGHRAHWALLLGYSLAVNWSQVTSEPHNTGPWNADKSIPGLMHLNPKQGLPKTLLSTVSSGSYSNLIVYAKQGKSKHLKAWSFELLCESNCNLVEMSPKHDKDHFLLPENGLREGLCNKSLFMKQKVTSLINNW